MFYIVATPIGNLEDITLRALRILKEVDIIACEDTRVTGKLLSHFDISGHMISVNARTEANAAKGIIKLLNEGKTLAYVSDAGTPTISDPGARLVSAVREALPDVDIVPIPGANALTTALCVSGLPSSDFVFLGFLPHKKGRQKLLKEISDMKRTVVLYESPHRFLKLLDELEKLLPEAQVVVARELTKIYESFTFGRAVELKRYYTENPEQVRGEFVIMIHN